MNGGGARNGSRRQHKRKGSVEREGVERYRENNTEEKQQR